MGFGPEFLIFCKTSFLGLCPGLGTLPPLGISCGFPYFPTCVFIVVTFTTYSPSCVVSVFVSLLPLLNCLVYLLLICGWYFGLLLSVCLLSDIFDISVFVFVICVWVIVLFLGWYEEFGALFSVVMVRVVFVYCVCVGTGLYVSYNLRGTIVLFVCCFVVNELYLLRLIVFLAPVSLIILLSTDVVVYPLDWGAEVFDENLFKVVLSKGVLSLSWCVIEVLLLSFFFTFFVSWYS